MAEGGDPVKAMDTDSMQVSTVSTRQEDAFQVIIIGDSGVGKTSIMLRLVKDTFYENVSEAGYVSDFVKELDVSGKAVKLHVWDTAGLVSEWYGPVLVQPHRLTPHVMHVLPPRKEAACIDFSSKYDIQDFHNDK